MIRYLTLLFLMVALQAKSTGTFRIEIPADGFTNQQQRVEFGLKLKDYFERLGNEVQTLKPTETDYVEKELKRLQLRGTPPTQIEELVKWRRESTEFYESKEYRTWRVKQGLDRLIKAATAVSRKVKSAPQEAKLWNEFSVEILTSDAFENIELLNTGTPWNVMDIMIGSKVGLIHGHKAAIAAAINDYVLGEF
ncbi:MAG: hypothetical protein IPK15_15560 [Verrucomicrobia bacterium]|nr:hypothetical protein [Verrucomicrobiota bacterium]